MSRGFDPLALIDDETGTGSFADLPAHDLLARLLDGALTGVLAVPVEGGENRLFFREGQPVGVELVEVIAPLGQLMLELGHIDSASYVRVQHLIEDEGRLPGQVYIEQGFIDVARLRDVLRIQAARKAARFVERCDGGFTFQRGLGVLSGFSATPLSADLLVLLALRGHFDATAGETYLAGFTHAQVRAPEATTLPLEDLGYGRAEERFLSRLREWQNIRELDTFGTLPREQMALLLRFLDLRHLLQQRPAPEQLPALEDPAGAAPAPPEAPSPVLAKAARLRQQVARGKTRPRREKTERISMALTGWKEPHEARAEKTEPAALPLVMVDEQALGAAAAPIEGAFEEEPAPTVPWEPEDAVPEPTDDD